MSQIESGKSDPNVPAELCKLALATVATIGVVAAVAASGLSPRWATIYLAAGVWALVFFGLSAMIFKSLLLERRRPAGFGWVALKLFWLLLFFVLIAKAGEGGAAAAHQAGFAILAGVTTPLVVAGLKLGGQALDASHVKTGADCGGRSAS